MSSSSTRSPDAAMASASPGAQGAVAGGPERGRVAGREGWLRAVR